MKIKDASDKMNEALDSAAGKVERARLTKWVLVALAVVLILLIVAWARAAHATGYEHAVPIVVKAATVVPPTVVTPPVVTPPVAPPTTAPPAQPPSGSGPGALGWYVMAGVAVYFWAVICVAERAKNPDGFWARRMCLKAEPRT